jgi:flagellar motor switch protein FliN
MDEIEYTQLDASEAAQAGAYAGLDRLRDVPVDLVVEIGRTRMTIGEALKLSPGSVIGLNRLAGDPVNLLVNGKPIARGEVVVVDEEFGLRVTEVVSDAGPLNGARSTPPMDVPAAELAPPPEQPAPPAADEPVAAEPLTADAPAETAA